MVRLVVFLFLLSSLNAKENLFTALPIAAEGNAKKVELGRLLFHDPILSKDNTVSCASCHPLINYGVDNLPKSFGVNNAVGKRNTPTVWNAVYNFSQFWDGRAKDLEEQALEPIINPFEMNETLESVITKLKKNQVYTEAFEAIYADGITQKNLANAIAEFEKTLTTPDSKFDRYLRGDETAMNAQEKEGLRLFKSKGCIACHNGMNVGGTLYQKIGIFGSFPGKGSEDLGRYNVTKKPFDKYYFKVPSLRNVEKTGPYFHDGSMATLKGAVMVMVNLQLGHELRDDEIEDILSFLKTLTGKVHE